MATFLITLLLAADSRLHWTAVGRDGTAHAGRLTEADGSIVLRGDKDVPLADLEWLRSSETAGGPIVAAPVRHRVRLAGGQSVAAELRQFDGRSLKLRTALAGAVSLPAERVAAVGHAEDVPVSFDGSPPRPVRDGSVAAVGKPGAALRLKFGDVPLTVDVDGPRVRTPLKASFVGRVPAADGPRRLAVTFSRRSVAVAVDGYVAWAGRRGDAGPLTSVEADKTGVPVISERRGPIGIRIGREGVMTAAGDRLFGKVTSLGPRKVVLDGRLGRLTLSWTRLAAVRLNRPEPARGSVRLELLARDGLRDELVGDIKAVTKDGLTFRHADLGTFNIPWASARVIRPLNLKERK